MICQIHLMHQFFLLYFLMVAVVGGDSDGAIAMCSDIEREALLHFKASLEDPSNILSTWRRKVDCCLWNGVWCDDETGHVTELHLSKYDPLSRIFNDSAYGLVGEISPSLVNLTYLNFLDLSYNSFNGTIPTFIGSMTSLTNLNLDWNSFHGIIPLEFGNLTNLQYLSLKSLGGCTFENLNWLPHLSRLGALELSGNSIAKSNHWVNVILSLPQLSFLNLSDCDLSEVMYPYSSSFFNSSNSSSSIDTLYLSSNNLNSSMYSWLFPLTSNRLGYLDLSYNKLDGIPKYLGNLSSLAQLMLYENSATANFTDFLSNLSSGSTPVSLWVLDVSSSQFIGPLSDEIQHFSRLYALNISHNQLDGTISDKVWELPILNTLDISSNFFRGVDRTNGWSNLTSHDLSSCKPGPCFPKLTPKSKNLTYINIANNKILYLPLGICNTWSSQMIYLNLSCNNITGEAQDLSSNFESYYSVIDLSTNNFSGPIMNVSTQLVSLNLSKNKFYGGLSFLCQIGDELSFLDLSHNSFTGSLPDCLWHFKNLTVLNLGENNLSGRLPNSIGHLAQLEVLHLYDNKFSGELPPSLKNCTRLNFLNLGANIFFGNVPVWIGESLSRLYILSLGSNNFSGTIPLELCQLTDLQVLDLSMNHLYGTIPTCLNNFTVMVVSKGFSPEQNMHSYDTMYSGAGGIYADHAFINWQGNERDFTSNLRFLRSIDLSSNNLTGQIPNELTELHELIALNLSMNALLGEIPRNISEMKKLIILDLSRNKFSGRLPSSMAEMTTLGYLDVSYNNLSGRIPSSTQLQTFEPSRYAGNTGLCGLPIMTYCPGDRESEFPHVIAENEEGVDELGSWFYVGGGIGFATGFWITCSVLLVNNHGRHVFFQFLDSSKDWIYVKVMVFISKW